MKLSDFDFELPEELIAQHPTDKRDESRLLVLHKNTGEIEHRHFYDIINCTVRHVFHQPFSKLI